MTIYCFHHSVDWDGYASAAIVKYFNPSAIMWPYNYGQFFPFDKIEPDDTVYMVDISIQPYTEMLRLYELLKKNLIILDHHASFIESDVGKNLKEKMGSKFYFVEGFAACELTWMYCHQSNNVPKVIRLLGQYDAWRDKIEKMKDSDTAWGDVLAFQFGMRLDELEYGLVTRLINAEKAVDQILLDGRSILRYQDSQNKISMHHAFDATIQGLRCLCLNTGHRNSQTFVSRWDREKYDVMVAFSMDKEKKWSYSFYTDKPEVDVSKIASHFGGGGHKQAAGCKSDILIF